MRSEEVGGFGLHVDHQVIPALLKAWSIDSLKVTLTPHKSDMRVGLGTGPETL